MKNALKIGLCFSLFFIMSCGYRFEGGGYINDDVTRVAVNSFANNSSETGAGIKFTNALVEEISSRTDTRVVEPAMAEVTLDATINAITFSTLSRSTTENVTERRVTASVDVKMKNKDGEVIWSVKDFSSNEDYSVSDDTVTDEANKSEAIDKIATRVAERLVSKMLTNF